MEVSKEQQSTDGSLVNDQDVLLELKTIKQELQTMNSSRFYSLYKSIPKLLMVQFAQGIVFGLGSFLGASIVVSIIIYMLSQIAFVPVIGEFVKLIMQEIKM